MVSPEPAAGPRYLRQARVHQIRVHQFRVDVAERGVQRPEVGPRNHAGVAVAGHLVVLVGVAGRAVVRAGALMGGPRRRDGLVGGAQRMAGPGHGVDGHPVRAALLDRDAVRDEVSPLPHLAGLAQRAAQRGRQGVEAGDLVRAVEGMHGDDEEVCQRADDGQGQRHDQGRGPGLAAEGVEHLAAHPDEHQGGEDRDPQDRGPGGRLGQAVELGERHRARVVLVTPEPVSREGEEPVRQDGDHAREQDREDQVGGERALPVHVGDPGEEVEQQAEVDHQDQHRDAADPPGQPVMLA